MTSFTNLIVALIVCLATVPVSALERSTELFLHADIESDDDDKDLACASFLKYADQHCLEGPTRKITFTTRTTKGSPCVHDAKIKHISVKDQYCDLDPEAFHETEYIGSESCHVKWYQKMYSPEKLKFTHDTCVGGYQLRYCVKGKCPEPGDEKYEEDTVVDDNDVLATGPNIMEHHVSVQ